MGILRNLDRLFIRHLGLPWLRLTRERSINERFCYCLAVLDDLRLEKPAILDVGCGSGLLLRFLQTYPRGIARYDGIDHRIGRLDERYAGSSIPFAFREIHFDSDWTMPPCDFAWSSEVLEHLFDDSGVLGRIAACVRPGGYVVVTMPSLRYLQKMAPRYAFALDVSATQDGGHVRPGYTPEALAALAEGAGLRMLRIDAISPRTPFEFWIRLGLPYLWHALDRIPLSGKPAFAFGADDRQLDSYYSIAAVLQKPDRPA